MSDMSATPLTDEKIERAVKLVTEAWMALDVEFSVSEKDGETNRLESEFVVGVIRELQRQSSHDKGLTPGQFLPG